jgi:predicted nucleic-acid-binding Zn-ribbon protein
MKNSQACPKCQSKEILQVPGESQQTGYDDGPNFREKRLGPRRIYVDQYVCGSCGYVEAWMASPEELEKVRKRFG